MDDSKIYDVKRKMLIKYPRFGSEIAKANIEFKDDLPFHTAATDGRNIYIDSNYFESISEDDRLFTIAHEIMHIKFMHMFRLIDKEGNKRDLDLWNIATDAIINANLERDGFTIKEGYVNMPEALNYSAEEFYQILLQEREKKQQEQQQSQNGEEQYDKKSSSDETSQNQDGKSNDNLEDEKQATGKGDDHSFWEEAFKNREQNKNQDKNRQEKPSDLDEVQPPIEKQEEQMESESEFDEKNEFSENRQEKRKKFEARREKTKQDIRRKNEKTINLGSIGESKEEIDWKILIRREMEKSQIVWSQRRSVAENNYAYRLEENDIEDEAESEIMIDISGSVQLSLVKSFLRQIKPLLKHSKIRVGCFNEKFWGFKDIKSVSDIDNFIIPSEARGRYAWTEDWDLAVRSFSPKKEVNKIVFTDGCPCPGTMPKDDLRKQNVIWLVYGNEDFNPCCGKVINITEKQLEQLHFISTDYSIDDISR